jgi:hypothetical protein
VTTAGGCSASAPAATLFEVTLGKGSDQDFYDADGGGSLEPGLTASSAMTRFIHPWFLLLLAFLFGAGSVDLVPYIILVENKNDV